MLHSGTPFWTMKPWLSNFRVSVFDGPTEVFGQNYGAVANGGSVSIELPHGTVGDRVRVQLNGKNWDGRGFLPLAEVQVFGTPWASPLQFVQELRDADRLSGVGSIAVSPDAARLYATTDRAELAVLERDERDGALTWTDAFDLGPVGPPTSVAVSPDSRFVYVAGGGDLLRTYRVDPGGHVPVGEDVALPNAARLVLSPDGANLYAARPGDSAISVFARDADTGELTLLQEVRSGVGGARGLAGVSDLVVTDEAAFATGPGSDTLVAFRRGTDGRLTFAQRLRNRSAGVHGMARPVSLVMANADSRVYVASAGRGDLAPGGVTWFGFDLTATAEEPMTVAYEDVEALTVRSADKADLVRALTNLMPLALHTGAGDDEVLIQRAAAGETTTVDLGTGDDWLELLDTGNGAETTVLAGAGDDTVRVAGTGAGALTTIRAGDGDDTAYVAGDELGSPVILLCGAQTDLLEYAGPVHPDSLDPALPGDGLVKLPDGSTAVSYTSLEVLDLLDATPRADAGGPYSLPEGGTLDLDASGSVVPAGQTRLSVEWDLTADGEYSNATGLSPGPLSWAELRAFGLDDDGTYRVAVRVTTDVSSDVAVADIVITNTPPELTLTGDAEVDQGRPYALGLASSDPGADTIVEWSIDWGDGEVERVLGNAATVAHVYGTPGLYTVAATATDEDGTFAVGNTVDICVNDVPPARNLTGPDTVDEGTRYILGLDAAGAAGDVTWIVDWGDGTARQTAAGATLSLGHTFADDSAHAPAGVFEIRATILDADGIYTATKDVTVLNVAPTLYVAGGTAVDEGREYTLLLDTRDPGDDALSTWTIDWGDGTIETIDADPGSFQSARHTYADDSAAMPDGTYDIRVTAVDEDTTTAAPYPATVVAAMDRPLFHFGDGADATGHAYLRTSKADAWMWLRFGSEFGGQLATVTSGAEQRLLDTAFFDVREPPEHLWIGSVHTKANYWSGTGEPLDYQNWAPGEPDPLFGNGGAYLTLARRPDPGPGEPLSQWDAQHPDEVHYGIRELDSLQWFWPRAGEPGEVLPVRVNNVAPTVRVSGPATIDEGGTFTLRIEPPTDPGQDTVAQYVVDWGDGAVEPVPAPAATAQGFLPSYSLSHDYADGDRDCTVIIGLSDEDGAYENVASHPLTVANVAPTIHSLAGPADVCVGRPARFAASASDPGPDPLTYTWDFGDGTGPVSGLDLTAPEHTYIQSGDFTVTLTVNDGDGAEDRATWNVIMGAAVVEVTVHDGTGQSSVARRISVTFDQPVTIGPTALALTGPAAVTTALSGYDPDTNTATWHFDADGDGTFGDRLPDGNWTASLVCAEIADVGGAPLQDTDAAFGDGMHEAAQFHSLFGDVDGDRDVDAADQTAFTAAWAHAAPEPEYDARLDYDGDGDVDMADLYQFRARLLNPAPLGMTFDASRPATFSDRRGNRVSVRLIGAGSGSITWSNGRSDQIAVRDTDAASSLIIEVGGGAVTTVNDIVVAGSAAGVLAPGVIVTGDARVGGDLGVLALHDVIDVKWGYANTAVDPAAHKLYLLTEPERAAPELYTVDLNTAHFTSRSLSASVGFAPGLTLAGVHRGRLVAVAWNTGGRREHVLEVDPRSGSLTSAGVVGDLASWHRQTVLDTAGHRLYLAGRNQAGDNKLYVFDLDAGGIVGQATLQDGESGPLQRDLYLSGLHSSGSLIGLAWNRADRVEEIYRVEVSGRCVRIGTIGDLSWWHGRSAFDTASDTLYVSGWPQGGKTELYTVELTADAAAGVVVSQEALSQDSDALLTASAGMDVLAATEPRTGGGVLSMPSERADSAEAPGQDAPDAPESSGGLPGDDAVALAQILWVGTTAGASPAPAETTEPLRSTSTGSPRPPADAEEPRPANELAGQTSAIIPQLEQRVAPDPGPAPGSETVAPAVTASLLPVPLIDPLGP
ncbi:MAG: PKD domain-containing protein [Planctomycetota bacterium]